MAVYFYTRRPSIASNACDGVPNRCMLAPEWCRDVVRVRPTDAHRRVGQPHQACASLNLANDVSLSMDIGLCVPEPELAAIDGAPWPAIRRRASIPGVSPMERTLTTVLITGAAGYVASYILPAFRERFTLRLVDNRDVDGLGRPVDGLQVRDISDLSRMDEYRDLFQGVDAVVHLAHLRTTGPSLHERYLAERGDVDMAYVVYQLALDEGVKRVVMASSNHASDFYERPLRAKQLDMVYPDAPRVLADNFYGWPMRSTCSIFSEGAIWRAAPRSAQPIGVQSIRASYFPRRTRTASTRSTRTLSA